MATTEQFSLRWNNFHSNLTSGFHDLFEAADMVDVTIAIDGQFLQAHKIVLSICSPYFKEMFKINPCKHPIVILKDISHDNMKDILHFMYLGEVNVLRENLPSFLRTAELLQVKGLTGDDSSDTSSRKDDKPESICDNEDEDQDMHSYSDIIEQEQPMLQQYSNPNLPHQPKQQTSIGSNKRTMKSSHQNMKRPKPDYNSNQPTNTPIKVESPSMTGNSSELGDDYEDYVATPQMESTRLENEEYQQTKDTTNRLMDPGSGATQQTGDNNFQDHGKSKVKPKLSDSHPFKCEKCVKRFSRRDHLRTHEKNIHGEDAGPFACVICSQLYKNSESLRKHIAKFHFQKAADNNHKIQLNV